ncbi:uncharacterized protein PAC_11261 [Phialocephala subalpina]|uniref:Heterokaryon incompatibility domain-containing protein n=1 Tax=Phialocephala subalpina TaxID=576137 RepID=A0A1L7X8K0_9HELO|nr:uncharacterized protein PAC_11261 [Phialocephala subalpina]
MEMEEYVYTPLQDGQIRLLEILPGEPEDPLQCHLRIVPLGDKDSPLHYAAVSYTWGDDMSDRPITVDGRKLSVKPNLEAALLEFRREPPRLKADPGLDRVIAAIRSIMVVRDCHRESFSDASRAEIDRLVWTMVDYATSHATAASLLNDVGKTFNAEFLEEAESKWNMIAAREGVPRLYEDSVLLWIDGLCINQRDSDERNVQVRIMARIYAKADFLVVWLGLGDELVDNCLKLLALFMEKKERGYLHLDERTFHAWLAKFGETHDLRTTVYTILTLVFTSPWFHRAWIVQEYVLGAMQAMMFPPISDSVLVCSGQNRFQDLITKAARLDGFLSESPPELRCIYSMQRLSIARTQYRHRRFKMEPGTDTDKGELLLKTVLQSVSSQATDPRDKIYSCLGLVDAYFNEDFGHYVPDGLILDYGTSVEDVYSSFVRAITEATKRLDVLALCGSKRPSKIRRTWTPDWMSEPDGIISLSIQVEPTVKCYLKNLPINVSPEIQSMAIFADDLSTVTVSGFIHDRLTADSDHLGFARQPADFQNMEKIFCSRQASGRDFKQTLLECLTLSSKATEEDFDRFREHLNKSTNFETLLQKVSKSYHEHHKVPEGGVPIIDTYGKDSVAVLTEGNNIVRPLTHDPRPGDLVCVILGCAIPLLLRPFDGYYELHGEVYVPGIMHGEAMTALKEGKFELQDFELH